MKKTGRERELIIRWIFFYLVRWGLFISLGIPISAFVLLFLFCCEPFRKIKFSIIPSNRIGHLALNMELFARRQRLGCGVQRDVIHIFILRDFFVANRFLLEMWKRYYLICESRLLHVIVTLSEPILKKTRFYVPLPMNSCEYFEFNNSSPTLEFTEDEEVYGRDFLRKMGIDLQKGWFICVYVRESRYLNEMFPNGLWSYHDYRNTRLEDLREAIEHIINSGGYVVRMGTHVSQFIDIKSDRYIDYAKNFRNEFMDIFLIAKCRFFMGSAAGIGDIAKIFDVPQLVVDCAPIGSSPWGKNNLMIPKKVKDMADNKLISYSNVIKLGLDREYNGVRFARKGYDYVANTSDEILGATKEMLNRVSEKHEQSKEDMALLENYYNLFPFGNPSREVRTPICIDFIRSNKELFI